jgi:hypothetical protein
MVRVLQTLMFQIHESTLSRCTGEPWPRPKRTITLASPGEADKKQKAEAEEEAEVTSNLAACKYNDQIIDCLCLSHLLS